MPSRLMRRGLIGAALVAALAVPLVRRELVAPPSPKVAAVADARRAEASFDARGSGEKAETAEKTVEKNAAAPLRAEGFAPGSPDESAPPPVAAPPASAVALALAPAQAPAASALSAIESATAPSAPAQLDAVTEAVRRFAEPVDPPTLALDADRLRATVAAYRAGDVAGGDAQARALADPTLRLAAEWAAIRLQPRRVGMARLRAFDAAHPDWPSGAWIERRVEESLYGDRKDPQTVLAAFATRAPETVHGEAALARAELALGRQEAAAARVRRLWREEDLSGSLEQALQREFGALLTSADHKARSDRHFYDARHSASLAAAKEAGADIFKLANARAMAGTKRFDALVAALPKESQSDPTLNFARGQALSNAGKFAEAAKPLLAAPADPAALVDGDAWWRERRKAARKLLDMGDAATAYALAAAGGAMSGAGKVEASFMAGWIALRHLTGSRDDALKAKAHFEAAAAAATTPTSTARAAYWRGRAAEALGENETARAAFGVAAERPATFYGQLAAARLGGERPKLRQAAPAVEDTDFMRVFRALYEANERALAMPLALDAAKAGGRDPELAALSDWIARRRDARTALAIGKAALVAGGALDETAFPTYGVPTYAPVANSADPAVVYSIARQESAFQPEVVSSAGAKGLMQMLDSTARETAKRAGLPFEQRRMLSDPTFNATLGAAHLGALLKSQKGSYVLAFAAYNAGPGRVKEWLEAYGDPREPGVDMIDWIERIPFAETRDYVQKTIENLQIYRLRLGDRDEIGIESDLKRGARAAR